MQAPPTVLRVALPVPLQRLFDYLPPPGVQAASVAIGQRILVPFAARELVGIVSGHGQAEAGIEPKPALALPEGEPLLQGELLASLHWLAGYLHAPLGEVLAGALPAALRRGEPLPDTAVHGWRLSEAGRTALPAMRAGKPQALATLLAGIRDEDWLDGEAPGWRAPLRKLNEAAAALIEKAKAGRLAYDDLDGGTFSVSNLGMFGIEDFDAIINPPQAAILAVGKASRELREDDDGEIAVETRIKLTLSVDHRVIDGAAGAAFLATLKSLIEEPELLFA